MQPAQKGAQTMLDERNECGTRDEDLDADQTTGLNRRRLIGAAVTSFVAGANGLLLPGWLGEAEAREGAFGGAMGGRGKNRRRHKRRSAGDEKDKDKQKDRDKPRGGGCINALSMTVIFHNISRRDHLMSVADGGGDCEYPMKYRWKNKVVLVGQRFEFVGWYPEMHLDLYSLSPNLHFEARNPGAGFPRMKVTKDDSSVPSGRRTILDQGFYELESTDVEGFMIMRQEDFDEHKVFIIVPRP
jgi:hypothetical protein